MSDPLESVMSAAAPALEAEMKGLAKNYLAGFEEMLGGENEHVKPLVQAHLEKAANYKWKAINADDEETRRAYAEGVVDELAAAKTVLISEATAISEELARTFTAGFDQVLAAVGSAAKAILGVVISSLVKSVTGGTSIDLSSVFPGA